MAVAFSRALLAPRWEAAGVHAAEVTIRYPASGGCCCFRYDRHLAQDRVILDFTGSGEEFELEALLPKDRQVRLAKLDGQPVKASIKTVEQSRYAVLGIVPRGVHRVELDLT